MHLADKRLVWYRSIDLLFLTWWLNNRDCEVALRNLVNKRSVRVVLVSTCATLITFSVCASSNQPLQLLGSSCGWELNIVLRVHIINTTV